MSEQRSGSDSVVVSGSASSRGKSSGSRDGVASGDGKKDESRLSRHMARLLVREGFTRGMRTGIRLIREGKKVSPDYLASIKNVSVGDVNVAVRSGNRKNIFTSAFREGVRRVLASKVGGG